MIPLLIISCALMASCDAAELQKKVNVQQKSAATESHLSTFKTVTDLSGLTINAGELIPFNKKPIVQSHSVKRKNSVTFTIKKAGNYHLYFSSRVTSQAQRGSVRFRINKKVIGAFPPTDTSELLILQEVVTIPESEIPAKLDLAVFARPIQFQDGDSAELTIVRLSK